MLDQVCSANSPTTPRRSRLITAVCVEQHDEWSFSERPYLSQVNRLDFLETLKYPAGSVSVSR